MSIGLSSPKRLGRRLVVSAVLALIASMVYVPSAQAVAFSCTQEALVDGYQRLTVQLGDDNVVAVRKIAGSIQVDPTGADLNSFAPDAACTMAGVDHLVINGSPAGTETLRILNAGTSAEQNLGDVLTFVNLAAGSDTVEFISGDTNGGGVDPTPGLLLNFGTGAGAGGTVVDQGATEGGANPGAECVGVGPFDVEGLVSFDCSDMSINDPDGYTLRVTGGTNAGLPDFIDAQGDFDDGEVIDAAPAPEGPTIAGTVGNDGLDSDGGTDLDDNEPNGGNLDKAMTANLNEGDDEIAPGDGDDTLDGGPGRDDVEYSEAGAAVTVDLAAAAPQATGGSGNDSLANFQDTDGTPFDDTLNGNGLANELDGFCGSDTIDGRAENDVLRGDGDPSFANDFCDEPAPGLADPGAPLPDFPSGDDTFLQGTAPDGADTIDGDDDSGGVAKTPDFLDSVVYTGRTGPLHLDANGAPSGEGACFPVVAASCEGDTFTQVEYFLAGAGSDRFIGSGADETFQGGPLDDNMSGGGGEDWFDFSDSPAAVVVDVTAGTATGHGNDVFDATVEGFNGSNADPGAGLGDIFNDNPLTDSFYWGQGGDDLFNQGASPAAGGADDDAFNGGDGIDTLSYAERTNDLVICLNGENPPLPLIGCQLENGESAESDDVLDDIENAIAGSGDDDITGNEKNNKLTDGDGNDVASGGQGNDDFDQSDHSNGSDNLAGGPGSDFVDYSLRTGNVRASLGGGAGNNGEGCTPGSGTATCEGDTLDLVENATTGAGNDLLVGSDEDNILNAGAGNDKVNPAEGADVLDGGEGSDRVLYTTGVGVKVNLANGTAAEIGTGAGAGGLDTLGGFEHVTGSLRADILAGDGGNNKIAALAGRDIVKGKKGDDKLKGNQGKDNLNGGGGTDKGNGGPGRDRCRKIEQERSCEV